jgi:hypothetical protein
METLKDLVAWYTLNRTYMPEDVAALKLEGIIRVAGREARVTLLERLIDDIEELETVEEITNMMHRELITIKN